MGFLNQVYLTNNLINWAHWLNDFLYWKWWMSIEATKICYFGLALSGIGPQPTRLSDILNLKNLKTVWGIKLIFCFHWSYKNVLFWVMPQNTLGQLVRKIFYFYFDLLILILGVYCYIVFVGSAICELVLKLTMVTPRRVIQLESCIN